MANSKSITSAADAFSGLEALVAADMLLGISVAAQTTLTSDPGASSLTGKALSNGAAAFALISCLPCKSKLYSQRVKGSISVMPFLLVNTAFLFTTLPDKPQLAEGQI